jgi:hypothetical protein
MNYNPDYLVIYMGNNEFSTRNPVSLNNWTGRFKWYLRENIENLRLYQLIKCIKLHFFGIPASTSLIDSPRIILEKAQRFHNTALKNNWDNVTKEIVLTKYHSNLNDIIKICKSNKVKVIICTIPVNIRDYPPYKMRPSMQVDDRCWDFQSGKIQNSPLRNEVKLSATCDNLTKVKDNNKFSPSQSYDYGCCALMKHDKQNAAKYFKQAVDNDKLPIRAVSSINDIIRKVAKRENVKLADVEKSFVQSSYFNIPGDEIFIDHVHPNLRGHHIIAATVFESIVELEQIFQSPSLREKSAFEDNYFIIVSDDRYVFEGYQHAAILTALSTRFIRSKRLCEKALSINRDGSDMIMLKVNLEEILQGKGYSE